EVARRLLAAEPPIQVTANGRVPGVAGELAHSIDVIHHRRQHDARLLWPGLAAYPPRIEHPGIEGGADDCAPGKKSLDLLIGELSLIGHQRPAIMMAGQHRTAI